MFSSLISQRGPGFKIDTASQDAVTVVPRNYSAGSHWYNKESKHCVRNSGPMASLQASVHRAVPAWRMQRQEQSEEGDSNTMLTEQWTESPYDRWQAEWNCGMVLWELSRAS